MRQYSFKVKGSIQPNKPGADLKKILSEFSMWVSNQGLDIKGTLSVLGQGSEVGVDIQLFGSKRASENFIKLFNSWLRERENRFIGNITSARKAPKGESGGFRITPLVISILMNLVGIQVVLSQTQGPPGTTLLLGAILVWTSGFVAKRVA